MESVSENIQAGRKELSDWENELNENIYLTNQNFRHTLSFHLSENFLDIDQELSQFGETVAGKVIPLVRENNLAANLPRIDHYDAIGNRVDAIVHHPSYEAAGNLIYGTGIMRMLARKGGLGRGLAFLYLSAHAGEAGHNCPIACSAGVVRVLQKVENFPQKEYFFRKLTAPSYTENFTGAQFVTEVQGGSDVGKNGSSAVQDERGNWRIRGEKWFCSNANADLILMTARYDESLEGTRGLGLFLVPSVLESGERNRYSVRRLKDKMGTRSLATAEMDFHGAYAIPMGPLESGFKILMENVLHLSRLFNVVCVIGMARRSFQIARAYAAHRSAFNQTLIHYPLVKEDLAVVDVENTALTASIFATLKLQDECDLKTNEDQKTKLLLRLLANLNKYLSAKWTVRHVHRCLDVLAGNGTIETFSAVPLLLRDSIICENWEGTHHVLRMQILRDIVRYHIDEIFFDYLQADVGALPEKHGLERYLEVVQEQLRSLRESGSELQVFQIQEAVDRMGALYAGVQLLKEALSQKEAGSESKMRIYTYFAYLHLEKREKTFDNHHLELINRVIGS